MDGLGKLVEGINSVEAAIESNRVKEIILLSKKNKTNRLNSLVDLAKKKKLPIREVKNKQEWEFDNRHSIVALCRPFEMSHV